MNLLFISMQEKLILVPLVYGVFILAIFYRLYKVLSILQNRSLTVNREHTASLLIQTDVLKEIAAAIRESNDKNGTLSETL
ncbi:hypothetical protein ACR78H_19605 [Sphingobacterium siyangense]|uniref:hypothetical protein n=1 Tax=Sphingobacterium siyangense TaxID=459529 RepID=UPI003DA4624B